MNIVIATEKKNIRVFDECMKNAKHNLLGYETELKSNFVKRIAEYYNPHILVVVRGVKSKNFDFLSSVGELLRACPKMRIIYFFGRLDKNNERDYLNTVGLLAQYGIYDILPYDVYERGFRNKFTELLATPLTKESLQELIDKRQEEEQNTPVFMQTFEKIIDTTPVDLEKMSVENIDYQVEVVTYDEPPEQIIEPFNEHITIAIETLSERQTGCTLTAFEIAVTLLQHKQTVAVFLDESTYNGYLKYHGINEAPQGCEINDIIIYPLHLYQKMKVHFRFSICDCGYTEIDYFDNAEIKICICSFDEWNISILADYLNSELPYIKDINYVFFPVSQKNFVKFSKQMIKGHCKCFRVKNSPDYTMPCDWNKGIYNEILSKYVRIEQPKKRPKKLFGLFLTL